MIRLIDLEVYKVSLEIRENIWTVVNKWNHFDKDTLGKQFVRPTGSVALNTIDQLNNNQRQILTKWK